jgi:hypothetical protein
VKVSNLWLVEACGFVTRCGPCGECGGRRRRVQNINQDEEMRKGIPKY